jgi:hypothetical protein
MVEFSKQPTSWKIILERMIGNVATSKVRALMYFVPRKEKKTRALDGVTWYHRMCNAIAEESHKPHSL